MEATEDPFAMGVHRGELGAAVDEAPRPGRRVTVQLAVRRS